MDLRYLYVGSSDTGRDVAAWLAVPGAQMRWRFRHFGADVAAIDLGSAPTVLLADHRPPGSVLPIYAVVELDGVRDALERHGWTVEATSIGTPEGRRPSCTTSAGRRSRSSGSTVRPRWKPRTPPATTCTPFDLIRPT